MCYGTRVPLGYQFRQNHHVPMTVCFMLQTLVSTHTRVYLQKDSSKKAGTCRWRQKILAWISSNHKQDSHCCYRNSLAFGSHFKFRCKQYVRQQRDLTAFFSNGGTKHIFQAEFLYNVESGCENTHKHNYIWYLTASDGG